MARVLHERAGAKELGDLYASVRRHEAGGTLAWMPASIALYSSRSSRLKSSRVSAIERAATCRALAC